MFCPNRRKKKRLIIPHRRFSCDLSKSISTDEMKLCYLKYLLEKDYEFTQEQIQDFHNLVAYKHFYIKEEENENIGKKYIHNHQNMDKILPTYIIFHNKQVNVKKHDKIKKLINKNDLLSRNSLKIFRDCEHFNNFLINDVFHNEFQKKNINVTIYGDNLVNKSIYKKLRVKYDFYYVLLNDYETTRAKIDFLKNKQILELLGAEKIVIDREYLSNKVISHMIGQGSDKVEHTDSNENSQTNKDLYKYKITKGFYSSVEDFLKKIDEDKYILLSRQEIMSDFELKSLLGARIEKGLNEFNKIIKISKVSKKEMKLNMVFNPSIGLTLSFSKKRKLENFLKIYSKFYGIEHLYCLDEIPLTYEGFKILNNLKEEEKTKYINNFYIRYLKKNNCLSKHLQRIESNTNNENNNENRVDFYSNLVSNINSFMKIEQLIESLQDPDEVKLNQDGFDTMRIGTIDNYENYNSYKKKFLKRFLEYNDIEYTKFVSFIETEYTTNIKDYVALELKSYIHVKDILREFLSNPDYAPCDERGHYYVIHEKISLSNEQKKIRFEKFLDRYIKHTYNKILESQNKEFLDSHLNIEILYLMDFFMFSKLCEHITSNEDLEDRFTDSNVPPLALMMRQSTPMMAVSNQGEKFNNDLVCMTECAM